MYRIVGADGREYGPVDLAQIQKWILEGRVNAQTQVRSGDSEIRKPLMEFPELAALLQPPASIAPPVAASPAPMPSRIQGSPETQNLAVAGLILGIMSFVCLAFTAIPAVICGHIARGRARSSPDRCGGEGMAVAGLITGYFGIALTVLGLAMALPAFANAKQRAQSIRCRNNLRLVGISFRQWAIDHDDQFPWAVSVTNGGTMELAIPGANAIDSNPIHFEVLSNELERPRLLICPADTNHAAAFQFRHLQASNISYQLYTGSNVSDANPQQVLLVCPIHGNVLDCDGSVHSRTRSKRLVY